MSLVFWKMSFVIEKMSVVSSETYDIAREVFEANALVHGRR